MRQVGQLPRIINGLLHGVSKFVVIVYVTQLVECRFGLFVEGLINVNTNVSVIT